MFVVSPSTRARLLFHFYLALWMNGSIIISLSGVNNKILTLESLKCNISCILLDYKYLSLPFSSIHMLVIFCPALFQPITQVKSGNRFVKYCELICTTSVLISLWAQLYVSKICNIFFYERYRKSA